MRLTFAIALLFPSLFASSLNAQRIAVDGDFHEWSPTTLIANDSKGDNLGTFDITTVSAISAGNVLFLEFDIGSYINLQNGKKTDGTLQLELAANGKRITIDFRGRSAKDANGERLSWGELGFQCLPTYASNRYELRVDLTPLGVKVGDKVSLQFAGSDTLDNPVEVPLTERALQLSHPVDFPKLPGIFRVVNQNTLKNGLADPDRQQQFQRLFAATDADAFCFQEEWNKDDFMTGVKQVLAQHRQIMVHWGGGCAIATPHKLTCLPMKLDRAVAGLVIKPDGQAVVVISAHFKCCGFAGSNEDDLRVQQAQQVVEEFKRMRAGAFGEIAKCAPVIIVGDYNLVGSAEPLDIFRRAGLWDVYCRTSDGSTFTWRGLKADESFWPGRLDLACTNGFVCGSGLVFDSHRMSQPELQRLGVHADDSDVSDHLMLVVDLGCGVPGD